jgi:hypothetical protein
MQGKKDFNFSYAGLKNAFRVALNKRREALGLTDDEQDLDEQSKVDKRQTCSGSFEGLAVDISKQLVWIGRPSTVLGSSMSKHIWSGVSRDRVLIAASCVAYRRTWRRRFKMSPSDTWRSDYDERWPCARPANTASAHSRVCCMVVLVLRPV